LDTAKAQKGAAVYESLDCSNCHEVEAGRSAAAPNLLGRGSLQWITSVIQDSSQDHLFSSNAKMPKFASKLSEEEITQLAQFIHSQQAYAALALAAPAEGQNVKASVKTEH
jgi:cytochrome c553